MIETSQIAAAAENFAVEGHFLGAEPYGSGHINDSFCASFNGTAPATRILLQRINKRIFTNPAAVMENIERVTAHLAARVADVADAERRVLRLIPTREGRTFHVDAGEEVWRAYRFIPAARSYDRVETQEQAFEAARAFGHFQQMLADLPAPRLHDTIPDFHNTPKRFAALKAAIRADAAGRARDAQREIDFALAHEPVTRVLLEAGLPERVTHNDTKLNNVLLDDATGEGICVIDLDTVMPGLALYDFGDLVRTAATRAREDETNLELVTLELGMFEALVRGYLTTAGSFLTRVEVDLLAAAGKLITFETGIRFLADHLNGDTYFKVHRPGHNLDRCRTQFKLVAAIEAAEGRMRELVAEAAR